MANQKKRFRFRGKQILLLGLVALVITAGYYRWTIEQENLLSAVPTASEALPSEESDSQTEGQENGDELSKLRQDRDTARSQSTEEWKRLSQATESSVDTKREAEKKLLQATECAEKERKIEAQIKAKGYDGCVAYVDEGSASVTVKGGEIDGASVAQMKDIIVAETGVPVKNIKINAM